MSVPYIGITDFTSFEQVEWMLRVFRANRKPGQNRRLHVGVMMSYKTLNGLETKWAKSFPPKETVASIFASGEAMNCLHYADYDAVDISNNLAEAIGWGGDGITAVQLDMLWPNPDHIARALDEAGKPLEVILQIGGRAFEMVHNDTFMLAGYVRSYLPLITHVLLDKSGGKGIGMDAGALMPFVRVLRRDFPELGITVAGGLGPSTLGLVAPVAEKFPDISIDAQGKLRPSGNALDPIDWDMAGDYLAKALALFR